MKPTPSEIRARILEQHEQLRERLSALENEARGLQQGETGVDVRRHARELRALLIVHLDSEEALLIPELREADGFGPARVDSLEREHAEQKQQLEKLLLEIETAEDLAHLVTPVLELIERVRLDMAEEEKTHLSSALLKDDIITSGFIG